MWVQHPAAAGGDYLLLASMDGRIQEKILLSASSLQTEIAIGRFAPGLYDVVYRSRTGSAHYRLVIQ